ncbi:MAG: penicillin acylase family protein [Gemmatimonadales bacterium]
MPTRTMPRILGAAALAAIGVGGPSPRSLADQVVIHRDTYGIPHVEGETDAAAAFGFGYAQAEDNFRQLEDNFIRALGRHSEVQGAEELVDDRLNRALEIPRFAREEYRRLDRPIRALVDGFADGINHYLARHRDVKPRLLTRMEPWYPLAFIRYNYYQNGFAGGELNRAGLRQPSAGEAVARAGQGSNGWAISPQRTADGHALLFINPHLPWFGPGQVYEGHLISKEGWNFTGYTRFGFPLPYVGHNDRLGWVSTDNAADQADTYLETFDDPVDPLAYRYGTERRRAIAWTDTIRVRTGAGIEPRVFRFLKTHHGPVVGEVGGRKVTLRMAKFEADGWLREWYRMTRARNLAEFKAAMRPLEMQFGNAMYADVEGNTFYVYNGAVPKRNPDFNWQRPLDGSDPRTDWQGYHSFDELPQLENPASGWMQNCNGTPFLLTDRGNLDSTKFPRYMVTEPDTRRSMISRRILAAEPRWTFDALTRAAFDTRVVAADSLLPGWLAAAGVGAPAKRAEALGVLREWNHRSDTASVAMTVFAGWADRARRGQPTGPALDSTLAALERDFGTWRVGWGELSRIQRWDGFDLTAASDTRPSVALPAVDSDLGAVFTAWTARFPGAKRRYGVGGGSYLSVVEFGPRVRARAVHALGASGHPSSPHYFDQARLFASGSMRPAWFTLEEIKANSTRSYRPGR